MRETGIGKEREIGIGREIVIENETERGRGIAGPLEEGRGHHTTGTGDAPGPTHHLTGHHGDG